MRSVKFRLTGFALLVLTTLASDIALAGIHRHDVAAERFIELGKQSQFACVGQLKRGEVGIASAVMISKQWALTAAHVFKASADEGITLTIDGKIFSVTGIVIHPDYKNSDTKLSTDLALIKLDKNYDGTTAKLYEHDQEIGKVVTTVGYGRFRGAFETTGKSDGKRAGQNVIDSIGGVGAIGGEKLPENFLGIDLTDPKSSFTDKFGNKSPLALEYMGDGGDSGGGGFIEVKGKWLLAGIVARSKFDPEKLAKFAEFGFYGSNAYLTRVSVNRAWINTNIKN